jgi:hypothetical protein
MNKKRKERGGNEMKWRDWDQISGNPINFEF